MRMLLKQVPLLQATCMTKQSPGSGNAACQCNSLASQCSRSTSQSPASCKVHEMSVM